MAVSRGHVDDGHQRFRVSGTGWAIFFGAITIIRGIVVLAWPFGVSIDDLAADVEQLLDRQPADGY